MKYIRIFFVFQKSVRKFVRKFRGTIPTYRHILGAKVRRIIVITKQNQFVLIASDMDYSQLIRGCASILISMQRYE